MRDREIISWKATIASEKSRSRTARSFEAGKGLNFILDAVDGDNESDRQLVISLAGACLTWANKSRRDELCWPKRDADRLILLLGKCGIGPDQIAQDADETPSGFVKINVKRGVKSDKLLNHAVAWTLLVARIVTAEPLAC